MSKKRILVVAQTPPPPHGQAVMTRYFLDKEYDLIAMYHIRMAFSGEIKEVGKFRPGKILHLIGLIFQILFARLHTKASILYFPPSGPKMISFLRDCAILIGTRWAFQKTVFHFHANGISEFYTNLPLPLKWAFHLAYARPDLSIRLSASGPDDAKFIGSKKTVIIPNAIPDEAGFYEPVDKPPVPEILYVGTLSESKGVLDLVEACSLLKKKGILFRCMLIGQATSDFESKLNLRLQELELTGEVQLRGQLTGAEKWKHYARASIFCFPSFYEAEGFPVVLLEALQFGLPIVSTCWRGIPDIVTSEKIGFLAPIRDFHATARYLELLLSNEALRWQMGKSARQHYEANFRVEIMHEKMESALAEL